MSGPCLHRTCAVYYITVLLNSTCLYRVHLYTAELYCISPAGKVTTTSHVRDARGRVVYSTVLRRAMGWKREDTTHAQPRRAFVYCNTIPTRYLSTISSVPHTNPLAEHSASHGADTVASERKDHTGRVTESPNDRSTPSAHDGVTSDSHVRWIPLLATERVSQASLFFSLVVSSAVSRRLHVRA